MLFATSSFATVGDNVIAKVAEAFKNDFSQASKVNWEKKSDLYFASFLLNEVNVEAACNEDGNLVATSSKISIVQLPLSVTMELSRKYGDYKVSDQVFEQSFEGQTSYLISIDNSKMILKLKCYSSGEIDVESKTKK